MARWTEADIPDLAGRVAVVTGSNAGLGREAAGMLARRGAAVVLACRNVTKAEEAAAWMRSTGATGDVEIVRLDLASLASVRTAAEEIRDRHARLDILVNNAGLMAVDEARTEDGFEMQFGVNHLGHFVLTAELARRLLATPGSRVVNVSSFGHRLGRLALDDLMFERRGYRRWPPYFQSKLANILFTLGLHRRLAAAGAGTAALAAHPGASRTDLGFEGGGLTNRSIRLVQWLEQSPYMGALPIVRAAVDPGARSGEFYGPRLVGRGHPVRETSSRRARRVEDAEALWRASEELTGTEFRLG